jgi:cell division protein FtsX
MPVRISPTTVLLFKRGIRRGLLTLKRERGWATSLLSLLGIALLFQLFVVAGFAAAGMRNYLSARSEVSMQMRPGSSDADIQAFIVAVRNQSWVSGIDYITRERALDTARKSDPAVEALLERVPGSNPFRDTVIVRLTNISRFDALATFARMPQWQRVLDPAALSALGDQQIRLTSDISLTTMGLAASAALAGVTCVILLLIVAELVRRRVLLRRDEVFVERMSGAAEAAVVVPFWTEASTILLAAVVLGVALAAVTLWSLSVGMPSLGSGMLAGIVTEMTRLLLQFAPLLVALQLLAVPGFGFVGAWWGTRGR